MMRNCKLLITIFGLGLSNIVLGQQTHVLSTKQAVDLAIKNNADVKNAQIDASIQKAKNEELTGSARPQVSGSIQGNYYLKQPLIQFPNATELGIYDVLIREGVLKNNSGTPTPITTNNGRFSVNNVSFFPPLQVTGSLQVQQLLFQPDVLVGLQARKDALQLANTGIALAEDKVKDNVLRNYYSVWIANKQSFYLAEGRKRLEKLLSDQEQLFKNGFIEKLDIDKTTVALNNLKTAQGQLNSGIEINMAILKQSIGLPQVDTLILTDSVTTDALKNDIANITSFNYMERNEIKSLSQVNKLLMLDVKRNKYGYYPTAAAFINYGRTGQRNPDFSSFSGSPWFWYTTGIVGLNVSIPIYDGNARKQKINQAKLNLQKNNNTIDNVKSLIDMEQRIAAAAFKNAILAYDVQERNMSLAKTVYETVKKKYEQGLSNSFEVLQSDSEYQTAQANYFKALYDAAIARIGLQKAFGKL
jgi:outer membrane protein